MKCLKTLFIQELSGRYDSEQQLVKALPKMEQAATCAQLKSLLHTHLQETQDHVKELEKVFKGLGEKPIAKKCQGTIGILKEGDEIAAEFVGSSAIDACIISTAQKLEHYEMASYGCLREWANKLKNPEAASIFQEILSEEEAANKALITLARSHSNQEALSEKVPNKDCCNGKTTNHSGPELALAR